MSLVSDYRKEVPKAAGECPECGSLRVRKIGGGRANDGSIPLRYRRCFDCGENFLTAEVVVPGAKSVSPFDEEWRRRNREYKRQLSGYHGGPPRGGVRSDSDRLVVTVRVQKARRRGWAA